MLELAYLKQASKLSTVLDFSGGSGHSVDHLERERDGWQATHNHQKAVLTNPTPLHHISNYMYTYMYVWVRK